MRQINHKAPKSLSSFLLIILLVFYSCGCVPGELTQGDSPASGNANSRELYGEPWATTISGRNLPKEAPDVKDDLYTYYNFDYLRENRGDTAIYMTSSEHEVKDAILAAINDESRTDHEIEQMRIFFEQTSDLEALSRIGFSEVQPYIDMIDEVGTIQEMNGLLASDRFPFSPFVTATLGVIDTRGETVVSINPNFVIFDALLEGSTYYQTSSDSGEQELNDMIVDLAASAQLCDTELLGLSAAEESQREHDLVAFEKAYGKHSDYNGKYEKDEYGACAVAIAVDVFTIDELCALCPNLPMREMLDKCGKGSANAYSATSHEWLQVLSGMWTDENLETIKHIARCKVLIETRPYRDHSLSAFMLALTEAGQLDADQIGFDACNSIDTFSELVAKIYVDDVLGDKTRARLGSLAEHLVETYEELIIETPWLDDESETRALEKLRNMKLNVLEPAGGYFDYGELELTPTEQGGTPLSNYLTLKQYRYDCESKVIGRPCDADVVWHSIRPTEANAFYDPLCNSINILPGFVTSALYTEDMSDAELIAGIGFVIGHEMSHGFDYTGSQIDAYGQPNPIFSQQDIEDFLEKCSALADYYSSIEYLPGRYVDGQKVIGEAAADLCGLQACLVLASRIDGMDYDDFFGKFAGVWAMTMPRSLLDLQAVGDTHPNANLRVNVNAQLFDAIYDEFGVSEGDGMYLPPEDRIAIWGQ